MAAGRFLPLVCGTALLCCAACDGPSETVSVTAEDYRFVPNVLRVKAGSPFILALYNAGREDHEFVSPVLAYGTEKSGETMTLDTAAPGLLKPGRSLRFQVSAPPGTYLYSCRRKGHANMTGTLIIE